VSKQEAPATSSPASMSSRARLARVLLGVLLYIWGTLVVGVIIATLANLNTTTTDTPPSKLFIIHLALTYPVAVSASLGLLLLLTLLSWLGSRPQAGALPVALSEQDRKHMLRRLRLRYKQMLTQSLQGAVQVELGLASRPAAVQNAASFSLRFPNQPEQLLPPHTSIVQAYELAQQEVLILGEPGAGKSTLLVELAHHLVEQAEQDASQPLPVLVPLSSWATSRRPLQDWFGEQLALLYDVPRVLSQHWIAAGQVLPLLDGLDEVEESARASCIAAINTYHRNHLRPLVVCSRTAEYETASLGERLALHAAMAVQPLSREEVDAHLEQLGQPLAGLRVALRKSPTLREQATTPLMLQVLMLTYHDISIRELSRKEAELREQIWEDYVQRMISRKGDARYPLHVTSAWLGWLAQEMREHNQTIFSLEQLQPNWLPTRQRVAYLWSVGLVTGLSVGLFYGLFGGLIIGLSVGLLFGLSVGLVAGLVAGLIFGLAYGLDAKIEPAEALTWSWQGIRLGLLIGLVAGLLFGLFFGLLRGLLIGLVAGLLIGLVAGLLSGLVLVIRFSGEQLTERPPLSPNEGIRRSVKNGLSIGLSIGLIIWLSVGLVFGLFGGLLFGLLIGLAGGLAGGLFGGLVAGLDAVIKHYILRFWLWRTQTLPWKAVPFLDDATARILLRRAGGSYSFTHRLLLDYFADLHVASQRVPGK
jgi:NACHT domain